MTIAPQNDSPGMTPTMTQNPRMSDDEIDERFRIEGRTAIQFTLNQLIDKRENFTAVFGGGDESFITTLLAVWPQSGLLVVDRSGSPEANARFLKSDHVVFAARPEGVRIQFTGRQPRLIDYDGDEALAVTLPDHIIRLQRRDNFRIETPRVRPALFRGRLNGGSLELPLHNLSVGGCCVTASQSIDGLETGKVFENCRLVLPEPEKVELSLGAEVRHLSEIEARAGARQWRVGLQFIGASAAAEIRIQRYIARIEHDRRERSG